MEKPHAEEGTVQTDLCVKPRNGNQGHLQRNNLQAYQKSKEQEAPLEIQPGKRITGKRGKQDRQECGGQGDNQAVDKGPTHAAWVEDIAGVAFDIRWLCSGCTVG